MTSKDYYSLTVDELQLTLEGSQYRQEIELHRLRILGSWIYGAQGSRQTPEKMLPLPIMDAMKKEQQYNDHLALIEAAKKRGFI